MLDEIKVVKEIDYNPHIFMEVTTKEYSLGRRKHLEKQRQMEQSVETILGIDFNKIC